LLHIATGSAIDRCLFKQIPATSIERSVAFGESPIDWRIFKHIPRHQPKEWQFLKQTLAARPK